MEEHQHNYARTHPARVTLRARNSRYPVSVPTTASSTDYNSMQLRKRTNQPSMREISDEEEGEEEVEEDEDEDEDEEDEEEEVYEVDVEDDDAEREVDADGNDVEEEEEHQIDVEREDDMEDEALLQQPRLRIKLKLPVAPSSTSNSATPVPEETRTRSAASSKRSAAVRSRRRIQDMDSSEEEEEEGSSRPTRPMTTRQAVLANVVDPSHVSLETDLNLHPNTTLTSDHKPNPRKKQLNESELALRREETARKRKNLSEKKLEDEKLETINRLLRKQSKPRAKKGAGSTSGGVTPVTRGGKRVGSTRGGKASRGGRSGLGTAKASTAGSEAGDEEGVNDNEGEANDEDCVEGEDEEVDEGDHASGSGSGSVEEVHQVPMFRWISTSRTVEIQKEEVAARESNAMDVDKPVTSATSDPQAMEVDMKPDETQQPISETKRMTLSFSIPVAFLSEPSLAQTLISLPPPRAPPTCAVAECSSPRKYRLVEDWTIGACGIGHLKILESQTRSKTSVA